MLILSVALVSFAAGFIHTRHTQLQIAEVSEPQVLAFAAH
jgi:hypothetical protein